MTGADKLLFLSANQTQAVDNICLLLDGLEHEGNAITKGPFAAENFAGRLRIYLGAFHFIVDGLEATGKALGELAEQMDMEGGEDHGQQRESPGNPD